MNSGDKGPKTITMDRQQYVLIVKRWLAKTKYYNPIQYNTQAEFRSHITWHTTSPITLTTHPRTRLLSLLATRFVLDSDPEFIVTDRVQAHLSFWHLILSHLLYLPTPTLSKFCQCLTEFPSLCLYSLLHAVTMLQIMVDECEKLLQMAKWICYCSWELKRGGTVTFLELFHDPTMQTLVRVRDRGHCCGLV